MQPRRIRASHALACFGARGGIMIWELWHDAPDPQQSQLQVIKSVMQERQTQRADCN